MIGDSGSPGSGPSARVFDSQLLQSLRAGEDKEIRELPVFLVVVDNSTEVMSAVYFASRRARETGGRVALLSVQEGASFQHFQAIGARMREEERGEAEKKLLELAENIKTWTGKLPVFFIREGKTEEVLLTLLEEENYISTLVLSARAGSSPHPLIAYLLGRGTANRQLPIAIIPSAMSLEEIDFTTRRHRPATRPKKSSSRKKIEPQ